MNIGRWLLGTPLRPWLRRTAPRVPLVLVLASLAPSACSHEPAQPCVEIDVQMCRATIEPTFTHLFQELFAPNCGRPGATCHGSPDAIGAEHGGPLFADENAAYTQLTDPDADPPFVDVDDPGCSLLVRVIESEDPLIRMPPIGERLSDGERCAIEQWIAAGAPR